MATKRNEWVKKRWAVEIDRRGGHCENCQAMLDLEFAHIKPTKCKGMGRGKSRRLADIMKHPKKYRLLCMNCHDDLDGRKRRRRQSEIVNEDVG